MTSNNPFTAFGETYAPTQKPRRQGVSAREATRREKALQERDRLSLAHQRWRKEAFNALLKGPHGAAAQTLIDFLEHMEVSDAPELIAHVSAGPWRGVDADARFLILVLVDAAIIHLRERAGLVPFDDPLRDEESNTFLTIRKLLQ
jgi:hypothetical protein